MPRRQALGLAEPRTLAQDMGPRMCGSKIACMLAGHSSLSPPGRAGEVAECATQAGPTRGCLGALGSLLSLLGTRNVANKNGSVRSLETVSSLTCCTGAPRPHREHMCG